VSSIADVVLSEPHTAQMGHAVAQLVEALHATSRKVADLIPNGVIRIFH